MVHKMMSSFASRRDKADDGAIIGSVSYKTGTKDACVSDHLISVTENRDSVFPVSR